MLIYNAKIVTMAAEDFENGYIKIKDGKISDIGDMKTLKEKPAADDVNAYGLTLYPGFIDAHTHLGVWEDGLGFEGDDGNEETDPCTPQLRAIDMINPTDRCFSEALGAGITTVISGMGSANAIGGSFVAMKTYGSKCIDKRIVKNPLCIKFALGENPKTIYNDKDSTPATRMAIAAIIREQLFKAARYMEDWIAYEKDKDNTMPEYDMKCEALIPLLKGEIKAYFHCHRADDIFTAVRIAKEFNLRYVIIHATEAHDIAAELKEENAECIIGPILCDRSKPELRRHDIANGAALESKGMDIAICTDHPVIPVQYLPISAGMCIKAGMSERKALEALTVNPAKICEIDDRAGTLEKGKDADIIGFDGKFYEVMSSPRLIIAGGNIIRNTNAEGKPDNE